ncbi:MAG: hypothetical protein EBR32_02035 [Bacteroidetes bacterium]|nr:hypothetical protein [Bacteroidota bacterium]
MNSATNAYSDWGFTGSAKYSINFELSELLLYPKPSPRKWNFDFRIKFIKSSYFKIILEFV